MKKKISNIIFLAVGLLIVLVLVFVLAYKPNNTDESTAKCIADNSKLYVSKTCSHCAQQKIILGDYIAFFDIVDCTDNPQECIEQGIQYVPTWVIGGEKYTGAHEIQELKEITGC